jgi:hypothetical protein
MKISLLVCALLLLATLLLPKDTNRKADMFRIPTTAVKMAEAVLTPVYGEQQVLSERPYIATLKEGVWFVDGTLHGPGASADGNVHCTEGAAISKENGRILSRGHGK